LKVLDATFYDFTIVGAGSSGLWLADALNNQGLLKNQTLIIVESDDQKENDRTWCYWAKKPIEPRKIISKEWKYLKNYFSALSPYTYYHVRSQDFYKEIKSKLEKNKNIYWITDTAVRKSKEEGKVKVITQSAEWTTNKLFLSALLKDQENDFDSIRSFLHQKKSKDHLFLWQSFAGWRIKTKTRFFNPTKMTMMDFDIPQNKHTQFLYELPFSENEALLEITRFSKEKITKKEAEEIISIYLKNKNVEYEILEEEIGAIPMTSLFNQRQKILPKTAQIIYIGTLGGSIKPTTGYGFKRMKNYADDLAISIKRNTNMPTMFRKHRFRVYDILLLQIINEKPEQGKEIFERLFSTQPLPRILRFLDEETSLLEEMMIFSKLPILLFLNSLKQLILGR